MFGKIELRNTWLVLGICCVITFIIIFMLQLFAEEDTNRKRGYSALLNFSLYNILLPGILFCVIFYYLYLTDPNIIRAAKLATSKKLQGASIKSVVVKPIKKKAPVNNNSNNSNNNNNNNKD